MSLLDDAELWSHAFRSIIALGNELEDVKQALRDLRSRNGVLTRENNSLREDMAGLRRENSILKKKMKKLEEQAAKVNATTTDLATVAGENRVLAEIVRNDAVQDKRQRKWSREMISMAFILYAASAKCYKMMGNLFAMPAVSVLYQRVGTQLTFLKNQFTELPGIELITRKWRIQISDQILPSGTIDVILAMDAASFRDLKIAEDKNIHCIVFMILPIAPSIPNLVIHLIKRDSGTLGVNEAPVVCREVMKWLAKSNINVVSVASDGDRSYLRHQNEIFLRYSKMLGGSLDEICDYCRDSSFFCPDISPQSKFWWIGDLLHIMKCQRCRLQNDLYLMPGEVFNCVTLNKKLHLRHSLTDFKGINKMNDVYAVELFSVKNLIILLQEKDCNLREIEYMTPFVLWYYAVSVTDLSRDTRLSLLKIVFRIFKKWSMQRFDENGAVKRTYVAKDEENTDSKTGRKKVFLAENQDLMRFLNTVILLYFLIKNCENIALNRIGTHPVENYFGLIRVESHFDHTWDRFMSVAAKASLTNDLLKANGIKGPVRRDFSVAGVKAFCQSVDDQKLQIDKLLEHGMNFVDEFDGVEHEETAKNLWLHDLKVLHHWHEDGHSMQLYYPGPSANSAILSRIIPFHLEAEKPEFRWTSKRRQTAIRLHDSPFMTDEQIANKLGCTPDVLREFFERYSEKKQNLP
jgi:regulator of replication initiation timing